MTLTLYLHPLASYCHKVLIGLYENAVPFTPVTVDLADPASAAELLDRWPVGKIPVLHDAARGQTVPETTIILDYLQAHFPGPARLIPDDPDAAIAARLWDRFFDLYVSTPMQKLVFDSFRPEGGHDTIGVDDAKGLLSTAYGMIEKHLDAKSWLAGEAFTIAECSAAPALFFAETLVPFTGAYPKVATYFDRLMARPSVARVYDEAKPYLHFYPFHERIAARFR
jgi:glutathione S-transferase